MDKGDVTKTLLMDVAHRTSQDDINNVYKYFNTIIIPRQASVQQMWLHVSRFEPVTLLNYYYAQLPGQLPTFASQDGHVQPRVPLLNASLWLVKVQHDELRLTVEFQTFSTKYS